MTGKWRIAIITSLIGLTCASANARVRHRHAHPHRVVTMVTQPTVTLRIAPCYNKKERLAIALTYLNKHKYLTVKKYAKITKQPTVAAEAELNAFASDRRKSIKAVAKGKRIVYTKSH